MKMFSKTILFIIITLIITGTSAITYVNIPSSQFNNMKIRTVFQAIKAVVKDFNQRLIKKAQSSSNQTGTTYLISDDSYEVQYFSPVPKSRQNPRIVSIKKNGVNVPVPVDTSYIGGYRTVKPSEYSRAQFQSAIILVQQALPTFDQSLITKVKSASGSGTSYFIFFTQKDSTDSYEVQVYVPLSVSGKPSRIIFIKKNGTVISGRD